MEIFGFIRGRLSIKLIKVIKQICTQNTTHETYRRTYPNNPLNPPLNFKRIWIRSYLLFSCYLITNNRITERLTGGLLRSYVNFTIIKNPSM
jgi:hypothetical protein